MTDHNDDWVLMVYDRSIGSRNYWECPECGNRTTTAKGVVAYCTRHTEGDE